MIDTSKKFQYIIVKGGWVYDPVLDVWVDGGGLLDTNVYMRKLRARQMQKAISILGGHCSVRAVATAEALVSVGQLRLGIRFC